MSRDCPAHVNFAEHTVPACMQAQQHISTIQIAWCRYSVLDTHTLAVHPAEGLPSCQHRRCMFNSAASTEAHPPTAASNSVPARQAYQCGASALMQCLCCSCSCMCLSCAAIWCHMHAAAYVRKFMERPLQEAGFEQIEFLEVIDMHQCQFVVEALPNVPNRSHIGLIHSTICAIRPFVC